jgi:prepilin-type N-terminal cleavage/methylation domain-containing protein
MRRIHSLGRERAGFTIIELLVVIAIIAVLAALSLGAYFRVLATQYVKQSETTVRKISTGLEAQWTAVLDDAQAEIKNGQANALLTAPGVNSNPDMAQALYLKLRLRQEFPQTFKEANPAVYNPGLQTLLTTYGIKPKTIYASTIGNNPAQGSDLTKESAILLYLALTQTRRGATFKASDAGGGAVGTLSYGNAEFPVFIDAWGTYICFERWSSQPNRNAPNPPGTLAHGLSLNTLETELSQPPYGTRDTTDPFGKLTNSGLMTAFQLAVVPGSPTAWPNYNYAPVVYSFGPDKYCQTTDDILSFRLSIAGQKGN